jgi:iron complex transport system ATP-binding protein
MTPAASLRDVSLVDRGVTRLHPTSLELRRGTLTGIAGRNGSGKSTLLGLLAGERRPGTGTVRIDEQDVTRLGARALAQQRSLLGQDRDVAFGFTVEEVVAWGRTPWHGTPQARQDASIIGEVLEQQGLMHLRTRPVTTLSGGERTRVHLARVLAQRAPLLLLDEADADLDLVARHDLDRLLRRHVDEGRTAVTISHDIPRMRHTCDDVVLLRDGRVIAHGPAAEILSPEAIKNAFGIDAAW